MSRFLLGGADDMAKRVARVPSGMPGLDDLIGGGLAQHGTVLVCGDIGTGKTTFGVQFLVTGARRGDAGVLVTVDEKPQHIIEDVRRFGWDLDGEDAAHRITVLDASPYFTALRGQRRPNAAEIVRDLVHQVRHVHARRLVIDSVTSLFPEGSAVAGAPDFLPLLIHALEDDFVCTTVLTARIPAGAETRRAMSAAEPLAAGLIQLQLGAIGGDTCRSLVVRAMRGMREQLIERPFDIVDGRGLVLR